MSLINPGSLNFSPVINQVIPDEGPKAVPIILDFSGTVIEYDLNLLFQQQSTLISMVQTIFIDMTGASHDLKVVVGQNVLNQTIYAKAKTAGYYQVLCPNPPQMQFIATALGDIVKLFLINVPIPGVVWATV